MAFAGLGFGQGAFGQYATGGDVPATETVLGVVEFGSKVTVTAARVIVFAVDDATHVAATPGRVVIFGNLDVTGTVTAGSTGISDGLDGLGT